MTADARPDRPVPLTALQIEPYSIEVGQEVLDDLHRRLDTTRLGDDLVAFGRGGDGPGWEYGTDPRYLKDVLRYWRSGFDWRSREKELNQLDHYRARVDGLDVHFAHHRAPDPEGPVLILLHGWPTGFPEMTRLVPALGNRFHLVLPSLPGYSLSAPPPEPGYGYRRAARALHQIMVEGLGYQRYGVHSTGAGAFVGGWLALDNPDQVAGVHTHDPILMPPPSFDPPAAPPSPTEAEFLERSRQWSSREGAYGEVQRTKPHSLAPALLDSPAGLAAWLLDKYRTWSDCRGDLESRWPKDDLLTIITLHWVTGDIGSSMRAYYERVRYDPVVAGRRLAVPTGVAMPRYEPSFPPRRAPAEMVGRTHQVTHWVDLPNGGHFASWEEPEAVAASIRAFFEAVESKVQNEGEQRMEQA